MATSNNRRTRIEDGKKRIRAQIGGVTVAGSENVKMVWGVRHFAT